MASKGKTRVASSHQLVSLQWREMRLKICRAQVASFVVTIGTNPTVACLRRESIGNFGQEGQRTWIPRDYYWGPGVRKVVLNFLVKLLRVRTISSLPFNPLPCQNFYWTSRDFANSFHTWCPENRTQYNGSPPIEACLVPGKWKKMCLLQQSETLKTTTNQNKPTHVFTYIEACYC